MLLALDTALHWLCCRFNPVFHRRHRHVAASVHCVLPMRLPSFAIWGTDQSWKYYQHSHSARIRFVLTVASRVLSLHVAAFETDGIERWSRRLKCSTMYTVGQITVWPVAWLNDHPPISAQHSLSSFCGAELVNNDNNTRLISCCNMKSNCQRWWSVHRVFYPSTI